MLNHYLVKRSNTHRYCTLLKPWKLSCSNNNNLLFLRSLLKQIKKNISNGEVKLSWIWYLCDECQEALNIILRKIYEVQMQLDALHVPLLWFWAPAKSDRDYGCVPFGKSKSGFFICWIFFQKAFVGFEIRRIQIQINGLVIYRRSIYNGLQIIQLTSGISSWIPLEFFTCYRLQ